MASIDDIRTKYARAETDDARTKVFFGCEKDPSSLLVTFLLEIAEDKKVYDLTRIEAIKAVGLAGAALEGERRRVADALVKLGVEDSDTDIQNYALQSLAWFNREPHVAEAIRPALDPKADIDVRHAALDVLESQARNGNPAARKMLEELQGDPRLGKHAKRILSEI